MVQGSLPSPPLLLRATARSVFEAGMDDYISESVKLDEFKVLTRKSGQHLRSSSGIAVFHLIDLKLKRFSHFEGGHSPDPANASKLELDSGSLCLSLLIVVLI